MTKLEPYSGSDWKRINKASVAVPHRPLPWGKSQHINPTAGGTRQVQGREDLREPAGFCCQGLTWVCMHVHIPDTDLPCPWPSEWLPVDLGLKPELALDTGKGPRVLLSAQSMLLAQCGGRGTERLTDISIPSVGPKQSFRSVNTLSLGSWRGIACVVILSPTTLGDSCCSQQLLGTTELLFPAPAFESPNKHWVRPMLVPLCSVILRARVGSLGGRETEGDAMGVAMSVDHPAGAWFLQDFLYPLS